MSKDRKMKKEKCGVLPLTSDLVFKAVFGRDNEECKKALIAVLNIILGRKGDPIVDIFYQNPFNYGESPSEKTIIMDIKVRTQSGEWIGIEMQVGALIYHIPRTLYYNAKLLEEQLESGDTYDKIEKSIVISILCGTLFPDSLEPLSVFRYKEIDRNTELTDISELYFLELDKIDLNKSPERMTPVEQLGAYIRYAGCTGKESYIKKLVEDGEEAIAMSDRILKKISKEDELWQLQRARDIFLVDQKLMLWGAMAEGEERFSRLLQRLIADGRMQDLKKQPLIKIIEESCFKNTIYNFK